MSRKVLTLASLVALSTMAHAGIDLSFDDMDDVTEIHNKVKAIRDVSISEEDGNKFLRLHTPDKKKNALIKIPTGLSEVGDFTLTFDWRSSGYAAGKVISLCDWNHNKKLFDIAVENGKLIATTYSKNRFKRKRLAKPKSKNWNRFTIKSSGNKYTIIIEDLAKGEEIYNSIEKKRSFRINTNVVPYQMLFNHWPGQGKYSYDYDNIKLESN